MSLHCWSEASTLHLTTPPHGPWQGGHRDHSSSLPSAGERSPVDPTGWAATAGGASFQPVPPPAVTGPAVRRAGSGREWRGELHRLRSQIGRRPQGAHDLVPVRWKAHVGRRPQTAWRKSSLRVDSSPISRIQACLCRGAAASDRQHRGDVGSGWTLPADEEVLDAASRLGTKAPCSPGRRWGSAKHGA